MINPAAAYPRSFKGIGIWYILAADTNIPHSATGFQGGHANEFRIHQNLHLPDL